PEIKETTSFDDFLKMDLRVGQIVDAISVEKSKKLLQLKVDDGIRQRTILSGIAEHFSPEEVIGRQITFLANLAPRKIMGVESEGMILMAEGQEGELVFLSPSSPVWNGGKIS
ncbi:MAG: Methionine--tRNA ligase, partial [Bacteroidota bacterium]